MAQSLPKTLAFLGIRSNRGAGEPFLLAGKRTSAANCDAAGVWLSLVEYLNGVQVAAGSNPVTPTSASVLIGFEFYKDTRFLCLKAWE